jgi:hypothetical protein
VDSARTANVQRRHARFAQRQILSTDELCVFDIGDADCLHSIINRSAQEVGPRCDAKYPCVGAEIKACLINNGLPPSHRTQRALPSVQNHNPGATFLTQNLRAYSH